jgi:Spy/CpxP family protein refolding chaperone
MSKTKTILAAIALLVSGAVFGMAGTLYVIKQGAHHVERNPEHRAKMILKRLTRALDLDDSQRGQIAEIIGDAQAAIHGMLEDRRPKLRGVIQDSADEIEVVLRPEQKERFQRMRRRFEERAERWNSAPRRPGGKGLRRARERFKPEHRPLPPSSQ